MSRARLCLIFLLLSLGLCLFGESQTKQIVYNGFPGGLNREYNDDACPPTQVRELFNMVVERDGTVISRPGFGGNSKYGQASESLGLLNLCAFTGTLVGVTVTGNLRAYYATATVTIATMGVELTSNPGQFAYFDNRLWFSSTAASMYTWNYVSTATATPVVGAPSSRVLLVHNDRLFAANGATVYETSLASGSDWAGGEAWLIGDLSTSVTGLQRIGRDLYIFKSDSIFRMSGYSPAERVIEKVFSVGSGSPDSIKSVWLDGAGESIIFYGSNNKLYAINNGGLKDIGAHVPEALEYLSPDLLTAVVDKRLGLYYLFNATNRGSSSEFLAFGRNYGVIVSMNSPFTDKFGTMWPISCFGGVPQFPPTSTNAYGVVGWGLEGGCTQEYSGTLEEYRNTGLFIVLAYVTAPASSSFFVVNNSTTLYDAVTYNAGKPILTRVRTRDEDAGDINYLKGWRSARVYATRHNDTNVQLATFTQYLDEDTTGYQEYRRLGSASHLFPMVSYSKRAAIQLDVIPPNSVTGGYRLFRIESNFILGPRQEW